MRQENQRPETGPTRDQRETKQDQRKPKERDPDALLRQTDRQTDRGGGHGHAGGETFKQSRRHRKHLKEVPAAPSTYYNYEF